MSITEAFVSLLAPHICLVCGIEGRPLCLPCANKYIEPLGQFCYKCGSKDHITNPCPACSVLSPLKRTHTVTGYDEVAKSLVAALKFNRAKTAADVIADIMNSNLPIIHPEVIVSEVPTANKRVRMRGYDQAKLIAKKFAGKRRLRYAKTLYRSGSARQVGASKIQRATQLQNAYKVINPGLVKNKHILLIDDVMTTGSTLEAAAGTLKQAGAARIEAATFAYSKPKKENSSSTRSDLVSLK